MHASTLLVLILGIAVAAGAAWFLLGPPSAPGELAENEESLAPPPRPAPDVPEPSTRREPMVVEPPTQVSIPRIAVLAEGEELPEEAGDPAAVDALHETGLGADPGSIGGAQLVQAVARVMALRFRTADVLEALERLGPDPEWPPDMDVRLGEVVEHWRRGGFEVQERGRFLLVTRPDE